jgi:carbohydrate kinase (thermoresistant glucokinase family)
MTGETQTELRSPQHLVVMGVTSCGKSTVGAALAARIGAEFIDGDSLHPQGNIEKMTLGKPLNDDDRGPWLTEIGGRFVASTSSLVIACSALKRTYRDIIRSSDPSVVFVHLYGSREVLARRMTTRPGHFMPVALLDSQLETLEDLQDDEAGVALKISMPVNDIVEEVLAVLPGLSITAPRTGTISTE